MGQKSTSIDHVAFKQSGFLYTIDYLDLTNKSSFKLVIYSEKI
jgi:hypothetical protein